MKDSKGLTLPLDNDLRMNPSNESRKISKKESDGTRFNNINRTHGSTLPINSTNTTLNIHNTNSNQININNHNGHQNTINTNTIPNVNVNPIILSNQKD